MVLPDAAGLLRFGMSATEVREVLTAGAEVRLSRQCLQLTRDQYGELRHAHDAWLNGLLFEPGWNISGFFDGLVLTVGGGLEADSGLTRIDIRADRPPVGPAPTVVCWEDIDLFGYPADEVRSVLPGPLPVPGPPDTDVMVRSLGLRLWRGGSAGAAVWEGVTLLGPAEGGWAACCAGGLFCSENGDALDWSDGTAVEAS